MEIRPKVKVCLGLGQEWVAWECLLTSYVSNEADLAIVDLDRNVSHPEYRYVTRPTTIKVSVVDG